MYKVYGIVGDPVSHSLSPVMHNTAFGLLGIKAVYGAFPVKKEVLPLAISGVRALGISGLSVTIPHKVEIMKYLDEVDQIAQEIGAVNTVVNKEGWLIGMNTDWIGVLKALASAEVNLEGERVVVLGAGGASLAVVYALKKAKAQEILVYNRTYEKAKDLAERFGVEARPWEELSEAYGFALINATSLGLKTWESPVDERVISRFEVIMDTVYLPLETKLLKLAKEMNKKVIDGLKMLLYQGVEQFKIWTGLNPPIEAMAKVIAEEVRKMEVQFGF